MPDAWGRPKAVRWAELPGGEAAFDTAEVIGLAGLPPERRDPTRASSYGVGALLRAVLAAGARRVYVGLGGSATVDGGLGCLMALGGAADPPPEPGRLALPRVRGLRWPGREALGGVEIVALADVDAPLCGPCGAAAVFGPQKGLRAEDVPEFDERLRLLADHAEAAAGQRLRDLPGAGAAGGLGFMLAALGARLRPGAPALLDLAGFDRLAAWADVVLTGEGRVDAQTRMGKLPWAVAERARRLGRPVLILAGALGPGALDCIVPGEVAVTSICPGPLEEAEALREAARLLEDACRRELAVLRLGAAARLTPPC
ncbi:MAG: glycerate kinase [Firmicutes bacterium]|nr:glycerate kinase [Bacillota bacterium]